MTDREQARQAARVSHLKRRLAEETQRREQAEARVERLIAAGAALEAHAFHGRYRCSEVNGTCECGLSAARAKWADDLRDAVLASVERVAPGSPDRILRLLRGRSTTS